MNQTTLFSDSIRERFQEFHSDHPEVYEQLVQLARTWVRHGGGKLGIATLFERLRWEWQVTGLTDSQGYKLNNNYRAHYARIIMDQEPDLVGIFEIRKLTSEEN